MRTRFRFIAALLALFGLTAALAEQAWAGACIRMGGSEAARVEAKAAEAAHSGHAMLVDAPRSSGQHQGHAPSDPSSCPMAAMTGATCGAVTMLAPPAMPAPEPEAPQQPRPALEEAPTLLQISTLFHPPRR